MFSIRLSLLLAAFFLSGCAATYNNPQDPFEHFNRGVYRFNDTLDRAIVKPVAKGYNAVMPEPAKMMVSNFFFNLNDVNVAINDLLQLKIRQAVSDSGRILVNSTVGMLGLVDVASVVGLERHNEDFGQTLGYWGIHSGPYLMLPLLGPSSVRDGAGLYVDSSAGTFHMERHVDRRNQLYAANFLDERVRLLSRETVLDEAMIDRYSFIRDAYLQRRQNLVYDGEPPRMKIYDEESDNGPDTPPANGGAENAPSAAAGASGSPLPSPEPGVSSPQP